MTEYAYSGLLLGEKNKKVRNPTSDSHSAYMAKWFNVSVSDLGTEESRMLCSTIPYATPNSAGVSSGPLETLWYQ